MSFAAGNRARIELFFDFGDLTMNKNFFDIISKDKESIENEYGEKLEWERLDQIRACKIAFYRDGSIDSDILKHLKKNHNLICLINLFFIKT